MKKIYQLAAYVQDLYKAHHSHEHRLMNYGTCFCTCTSNVPQLLVIKMKDKITREDL